MGRAVFESGRATLELARRALLGMAEGFDDDQWVHQPFPGANHALWILGHIAWEDDDLLTDLKPRDRLLSKKWSDLFGMGSTPKADLSIYPDPMSVLDTLASQREELIAWFGAMDETKLASALPDEHSAYAPHYGALMASLAWHEGFHTGQLSVVRKSLGMQRRFA